MFLRQFPSSARRGIAVVELAVLLPFLVLLLFGIWEVGRLIELNQILVNAAREGGRRAATGAYTNDQTKTAVKNYLKNAGIPTTNADVTVQDKTSGVDVSQASQNDQLQVSVSVPFKDVRWIALNAFTDDTTTVNATVIWYAMADASYPSANSPPAGN